MNSTSFLLRAYRPVALRDLDVDEILSPTAPEGPWDGALIDYNIRAERMGWLPSAPQLQDNPLDRCQGGRKGRQGAEGLCGRGAQEPATCRLSCEDPDDPANWPRNLFVWRSNLLGSSGKGHEYFLKHLLGTSHGVMGKDLGEEGRPQATGRRLAR